MSSILSLCLALALTQPPGASAVAPIAERGPEETARALLETLLARDLEALCQLTPTPFSFDGREARSREEVRRAWTRVLQRHTVAGRKLGTIELLTYDELVKRYGPSPERLQSLPLAGSQAAVADLGGRPTLILMKKRGSSWVMFAITD